MSISPLHSLLQWNLTSYRTKFSELKLLLRDYSPACVCLQETRLRDYPASPPSDYCIFQSDVTRDDDHERGSAILVHKTLHSKPLHLNTALQAVAARVTLSKTYTVCSVYLPHLPISYNALEALVAQLPPPFLLMGDFNAHNPLWGSSRTNERGRLIERLIHTTDISILNSGAPTHYHQQTDTFSTIDLTLCSSDIFLDFTYKVNDSLHDSDHYPIHLDLVNPFDIFCRPPTYNMTKANWSLFFLLTDVVSIDSFKDDDVNIYLHNINNVLLHASNECIPKTSGTLRRPPVPWWDADCDDLRRERLRAERAWNRSRSLAHRIRYNRARAQCRYVFTAKRRSSWISYISSINSRTSLASIWRKLRVLSGKRTLTPSPVVFDAHHELISDPALVADAFADHFASVGVEAVRNNPRAARLRREEERTPIQMEGVGGSYNDLFSLDELQSALRSTSEGSPGADVITYRMLKRANPSFIRLLLTFFNHVYSTRCFPDDWRLSVIIPVAKPNKDPHLRCNYRPIALTSCMCKLLEKMINHRLMWFLEAHHHITPVQFGFRAYRSTTDPLALYETLARTAVASKRHLLAIFFDLAKAYDTVWRYRILKLLRSYGIVGHLLHFIRNFLSDRSIAVRVGSSLSSAVPIREGIPQGSVLSCTCFLVSINDIGDDLPPTLYKALYVDDFALFAIGARPEALCRRLQLALTQLELWSGRSGFRFSEAKTVAMHICRVRGCPKLAHNLTLYGSPVASVDEFKYLGLTLDNSLTWRPHISLLKTRCNHALNVLKFVSHSRYGADRKSLLRLYIGLIKPKLDYGSEAFGSACSSLLNSLQTIQNSALRIASGAFRSSPILSLHSDTGIKPLSSFRDIKVLNYYTRLLLNPDSTFLALLRGITRGFFLELNSVRPFLLRAESLATELGVSFRHLFHEDPFLRAPWRPLQMGVCQELWSLTRSSTSTAELCLRFYDHAESHGAAASYFTDGSKTDSGSGFAVIHNDITIARRLLSPASVLTCELYAIFAAVSLATQSSQNNVVIISDSRSSLQAISATRNRHPICDSIRQCISDSNARFLFCWAPSHVGIRGNERADAAAKLATERGHISRWALPAGDFKSLIKRLVTERWAEQWRLLENNKLRSFKDDTRAYHSSCQRSRAWEVKLARLRIGHTHRTHSFLMSGDALPYCEDCLVPLTVKHVLIDCPSFDAERTRHFGNLPLPLALSSVLGDSDVVRLDGPLHTYLRDVNFYSFI